MTRAIRPTPIAKNCCIPNCDNRYFDSHTSEFCTYHRQKLRLFKSRGFSVEKFIELMTVENCDLCGQVMKNRNMDHDHKHCPSGTWCARCVRGIVCSRCNGLLAGLDDTKWLHLAEMYLAAYKKRDLNEHR